MQGGRAGRRAAILLSGIVVVVLAVCVVAAVARGAWGWDATTAQAQIVPGGHADRGPIAIGHYGCGACHVIAGIAGAEGHVGPPLSDFGIREYIAGLLPNTPDNLVHWLQHPQQVLPGGAMPDMGVTPQDARDIASFLYTER